MFTTAFSVNVLGLNKEATASWEGATGLQANEVVSIVPHGLLEVKGDKDPGVEEPTLPFGEA